MNKITQLYACAVFGCRTARGAHQLMCKAHWNMVPPQIQSAIIRHYKSGNTAEHRRMVKEAITAVRAIQGVTRCQKQD